MIHPQLPKAVDEKKDRLEKSLHDVTNGLSAVKSYGEVLLRRARTMSPEMLPLAESLMTEIDRVIALTTDVRRDTYTRGDVLACKKCGYTFVQLRANAPATACRRCQSPDVAKWKPA